MGAWGIGNFDNDDAGDLVSEIEDAKSVAPMTLALSSVAVSEYIEAPEASRALAASEIVAAAAGRGSQDLPDSVTSIISKLTKAPPTKIIGLAQSVTLRILDESELCELWKETEDFEAWQSMVRNLVDRLS